MSQFSDFIQEQGISADDLIATSSTLEKLNAKQRETLVAREGARRNKKTYEELGLNKPNSLGRGVSPDITQRAIAGTPIPRVARKKLVRAVNAKLAGKKADPIDGKALFGDVAVKKGKAPVKKK